MRNKKERKRKGMSGTRKTLNAHARQEMMSNAKDAEDTLDKYKTKRLKSLTPNILDPLTFTYVDAMAFCRYNICGTCHKDLYPSGEEGSFLRDRLNVKCLKHGLIKEGDYVSRSRLAKIKESEYIARHEWNEHESSGKTTEELAKELGF